MNTKVCRRCSSEKPLDAFHKWNRSPDGHNDWCKDCRKQHHVENRAANAARFSKWYAKPENKAKVRSQSERWREENRERHLHHRRIYNAKRRTRETSANHFTIEEWLDRLEEFNFHCAYCILPKPDLEPDHMVPVSRGGSNGIENIVPACRNCNNSKNDRTLLEFQAA